MRGKIGVQISTQAFEKHFYQSGRNFPRKVLWFLFPPREIEMPSCVIDVKRSSSFHLNKWNVIVSLCWNNDLILLSLIKTDHVGSTSILNQCSTSPSSFFIQNVLKLNRSHKSYLLKREPRLPRPPATSLILSQCSAMKKVIIRKFCNINFVIT